MIGSFLICDGRSDHQFHTALRTNAQHMAGTFPQHTVHPGAEGIEQLMGYKGPNRTGKAAGDTLVSKNRWLRMVPISTS